MRRHIFEKCSCWFLRRLTSKKANNQVHFIVMVQYMCVSSRIFLNDMSSQKSLFRKGETFSEIMPGNQSPAGLVQKYSTRNAHILYHRNEMNLIICLFLKSVHRFLQGKTSFSVTPELKELETSNYDFWEDISLRNVHADFCSYLCIVHFFVSKRLILAQNEFFDHSKWIHCVVHF